MFRRLPVFVAAGVVAAAGCAGNGESAGVEVVAVEGLTVATTLPSTTAPLATPAPSTVVDREPRPVPADTLVEPDVERPSTVAVVGDSLTVSAREEIERALRSGGLRVIAVDGLESRRMSHGGSDLPPGVAAVGEILRAGSPDLWVIALGTNDVASAPGDLAGFRSDMQAMLRLIPRDTPLIWVDLWIRDRAEPIEAANELIRVQLGTWAGGAAVVDWHAHGDEPGIITDDGVHLTSAGRQLFADSIVSGIDDLFAGRSLAPARGALTTVVDRVGMS